MTITCAMRRMSKGEMQYNAMSRFVKEIPGHIMESDIYMGSSSSGRSVSKDSGSSNISGRISKPTNNSSAKAILRTRAFDTKQYTVKKQQVLEYGVGDTVKHTKFGIGQVTNITEGGRDYEVTVEFVTAGTKKMFASFAKLKKV